MIIEPLFLKIKNFKNITEFQLDFDDTLLLVKGRNGSGKSTLFEAFYTVLFNRRPNGSSASSAIQKGKKSAELELALNINEQQYVFTRVIGKDSKFEVKVGDTVISGTEAKKLVDELVPSYVVRLSLLQDLDIKDILTKIVDIDEFTQKSLVKYKEIQAKLQGLEQSINSLKSLAERLQQDKEKIKLEISAISKRIQELQLPDVSLEELEKQQKDLFNKLNLISQINSEIQSCRSRAEFTVSEEINQHNNEVRDKLTKIYAEISNLDYAIKDLEKAKNLDVCPLCKQKVTSDHREYLDKQIQELVNKKRQKEEEYAKVKSSLKNITEEADRINELTNKLLEEVYKKYNVKATDLDSNDILRRIEQNKLLLESFNQKKLLEQQLNFLKEQLQQKAKEETELFDKISDLNDKRVILERSRDIAKFLSDKKVFKKALALTTVKLLNSVLSKQNLISLTAEMSGSNLEFSAINNNGQEVKLSDLSQGESAKAKIVLYATVKEILSDKTDLRILFLDEVIDSIDPDNLNFVIPALKQLSETQKVIVITHNNYALESELWDRVINMEEVTQ